MVATSNASGLLFNFGFDAQARYNPDNGKASSSFDLKSPGINTSSWSFHLIFLTASGEYSAAAGYLQELSEAAHNYFSTLFYNYSHPYLNSGGQ